MNNSLRVLADRRRHLIARAATQRMELGRDLRPWRAPLDLADQGISAVNYVRKHWVWVIGGALLLGATRPARMAIWLHRGWLFSRLANRLRMGPPTR